MEMGCTATLGWVVTLLHAHSVQSLHQVAMSLAIFFQTHLLEINHREAFSPGWDNS